MGVTSNWLQQQDSEFLAVLRSLSIFVIVFGHVGGFWFYPPWTGFLHVFVPIFFFISGAVSYNGFLKSPSIVQYLSKRIIGLLIPYYFICIVALFVFVIQNDKFPDFRDCL
ncbi:acyltransferase family protein [bacterium]|nr:acyltransferase family protein [bacterium]MBU1752793.1 acyltransferase family protein [bacterium]